MMIKHTIRVAYELDRYPTHCGECPAFTKWPYQCHNEHGMEGDCRLGYMNGHDMRDFSGNTLFQFCGIKHDPNVSIMDGE